jgi:SNF2 family DNA or RNA helicase
MESIKQTFAKQDITLKDYQIEGCQWMLSKEKPIIEEITENNPSGGILCDEMGLGKTIQTIGLIIGNVVPNTLILTPASLVSQWQTEFNKFSPETRTIIYNKNNILFKASIANPIIIIISYNTFLRNFKKFTNSDLWDRIVCDEIHYIRNKKTKLYTHISKIKAKNRWGLTGTPIQNYSSDLYSILMFLGFSLSYIKDNIKEIIPNYILKRTKKEVNIEMKSITHHSCEIEITEKEKDLYKSIPINFTMSKIVETIRLKQCSIGCNIVPDKFLNELWDDTKDNTRLDSVIRCAIENPNCVIFCSYTKEIDYINKKLKEITSRVDIINGKKTQKSKIKILENLENLDYLIIQINSGGTGLNLQKFNNAIITSPIYNIMLEEQAIARIYRIGQKKDINIYKFICKDTIDDRIIQIQDYKKSIIRDLLE